MTTPALHLEVIFQFYLLMGKGRSTSFPWAANHLETCQIKTWRLEHKRAFAACWDQLMPNPPRTCSLFHVSSSIIIIASRHRNTTSWAIDQRFPQKSRTAWVSLGFPVAHWQVDFTKSLAQSLPDTAWAFAKFDALYSQREPPFQLALVEKSK